MVSSSVPWKSITDIGECGRLSNPRKGEPDIGAIEAIVSLISEAKKLINNTQRYFLGC